MYFVYINCVQSMIKGSRLIIENTLLRFGLSYLNSENNFKRKLNKALTLGNMRKYEYQEKIKRSKTK